MIFDGDFRLVDVVAKNGELRVFARFAPEVAADCELEVGWARVQAIRTCEVCGEQGGKRRLRPQVKTLCDQCFSADRATAAERGERYAEILLAYLLSGDPEFPKPERLERWLQLGERSG